MRVVLQRVSSASVSVEGRTIASIGQGYLILLGIAPDDEETAAEYLTKKIAHLRVFEDEAGKMNRSLLDVGGAVLVVSQFTLYADTRKGRRPAFVGAAPPDVARPLVDFFADRLRAFGIPVQTGEFGAHMQVALVNDGPVTILMER